MWHFLLLLLFAFRAPGETVDAAAPGTLMKLACPAGASSEHPCRAVYFYGNDGKRHAFPNARVYGSWYPDFSTIEIVSASTMASVPLGANVTYRPGITMVKFTTLSKTYVVATGGVLHWVANESVARELYGATWNQQIDDVSDAFYGDYWFGSDIATVAEYNRLAELAAAPTIDANLPSISQLKRVETERGSFLVDVVTLNREHYAMITDTANATDCANDCAAQPLAEFAAENGATIGIHGTYFCPPDYADCAGKVNSYLGPVYNTGLGKLLNASGLSTFNSPMVAAATDGRLLYFHRTYDFGNSVAQFETRNSAKLQAGISNYPSLVENGVILVESEPRLDENQRTLKGTRGALGFNERFVYLVIARDATVPDLASIMKALGATEAMNLDGGGSVALYYEGAYKVGPGRLLPNAILFKRK